MPPKYKILLATLFGSIVVDQITKGIVVAKMHLGESIEIIPHFFAFTYVRNRGAAFSLLNDADPSFRDPFFLIMPLIVLTMLGVLLYRLEPHKRGAAFSVSLIIGGAIGNLIDRFRVRYVIDFIHFHLGERYHWPMFNIADSCVVVGALLSLYYLRSPRAGLK